MEHDEEGTCHGAEGEQALCEIGHALLHDVGCLVGIVTLVLALFIKLLDGLRDAEGLGVKGGLGDQAVGKGDAQDAGDTGGDAEEEDVPVEAGGLAKRVLAALSDERRDVMVEPEQNGEQDGEGQRGEDVADAEVPEADEPRPAARGLERDARGKHFQLHVAHASNVHEAREEDERQGRAVVLEEHTDGLSKQAACAELAANICDGEDEQSSHDGQVEGRAVAQAIKHLDALLEVDEGNVEAEDVAGKPGDPAEGIARICHGEDDVQNEGPSAWGSPR